MDTRLLFLLLDNPTPLFTNLRDLTWPIFPVNPTLTSLISHFIGPRLESLVFDPPDGFIAPLEPSFFEFLTIRCPNVKTLTIPPLDSEGLRFTVRSVFFRLGGLRVVDCRARLGKNHWVLLAKLPHLEKLTFCPSRVAEEIESHFPQWGEEGFPSLINLFLISDDIGLCTQYLDCYSFKDVTELRISGEFGGFGQPPPTLEGHAALYRTISSRFSHSKLQGIFIHGVSEMDEPPREVWTSNKAIRPDILRPILSFPNLSVFYYDAFWCMDLDDAFIVDVARSMPKLSNLWLNPDAKWPEFSRITLKGILPLVQNYNNLTELGLAVDARQSRWSLWSKLGDGDDRPGGGHCASRLVRLGVGDSAIYSSEGVAAFLSDIFPNVEDLSAWGNGPHEIQDAGAGFEAEWELVRRWIHVLTRARRQERRWCRKQHTGEDAA